VNAFEPDEDATEEDTDIDTPTDCGFLPCDWSFASLFGSPLGATIIAIVIALVVAAILACTLPLCVPSLKKGYSKVNDKST